MPKLAVSNPRLFFLPDPSLGAIDITRFRRQISQNVSVCATKQASGLVPWCERRRRNRRVRLRWETSSQDVCLDVGWISFLGGKMEWKTVWEDWKVGAGREGNICLAAPIPIPGIFAAAEACPPKLSHIDWGKRAHQRPKPYVAAIWARRTSHSRRKMEGRCASRACRHSRPLLARDATANGARVPGDLGRRGGRHWRVAHSSSRAAGPMRAGTLHQLDSSAAKAITGVQPMAAQGWQ